jgi:hypothetical protein
MMAIRQSNLTRSYAIGMVHLARMVVSILSPAHPVHCLESGLLGDFCCQHLDHAPHLQHLGLANTRYVSRLRTVDIRQAPISKCVF